MPTHIDTNEMRVFKAVAEHEGFGRAAEQLHVTQSAVSQTISNLESKLGVRLLARNPVKVTEAGLRLLAHAQQSLSEEQQVLSDIASIKQGLHDNLHLAISGTVNLLHGDRLMAKSLLISTDNAHGIHPNYADRHDPNHGPKLNAGPVIKINQNQRYATNSRTAGYFSHLCDRLSVPCQRFVVRTDMGCGSTIGPLTAAELGVKTIDVGVPTFAMHSIRELAGSDDAYHLYQALTAFYQEASLPA